MPSNVQASYYRFQYEYFFLSFSLILCFFSSCFSRFIIWYISIFCILANDHFSMPILEELAKTVAQHKKAKHPHTLNIAIALT